jgi:hypothetical protein
MNTNDRSAGQYGGTRPLVYSGEAGALQYGRPPAKKYRVELELGRRRTTLPPESVSIRLQHTGVSDAEVVVPNAGDLSDWQTAELNIYHGSTLLFRGIAERLPGPSTEPTARLAGRGIGRELARGGPEDDLSFSDRDAYAAIRHVWDEWTTFDARVLEPSTPTRIGTDDPYEVGGTPLEILQDLHETTGMRFSINHQDRAKKVESYVPREHVKRADWEAISWASDLDVQDYANEVLVVGAVKDDGTRAAGRALISS